MPMHPDPAPRHRLERLRLVGDLADRHRLAVQCAACRHRSLIDARWLRARRPAAETLATLAHRLRCTGCGRLGGVWWSVLDAADTADVDSSELVDMDQATAPRQR